jgi:hypothetical protein
MPIPPPQPHPFLFVMRLKFLGFLLCCIVVQSSAHGTNVIDLKIAADGKTDVTDVLQQVLNSGKTDLYFPEGTYLLGSLKLPAQTRLSFAPGAKILVSAGKLTKVQEPPAGDDAPKTPVENPLFIVGGDNVRIEGVRFDFSSGATPKNPTPVSALVYASGFADPVVSGAFAETSIKAEMRRDSKVILKAVNCRNVVLENSGATNLSHMLFTTQCANVTSRGNWMIEGASLTTFAGGSENLRHHDNWSRGVGYQIVWRGGSPDPSRKAPKVPLGSARVAQRGPKPGDAGYIPHTQGVFDVMVQNNYAEYGTTLCWGNKGRQTIVDGNTARFMFDYSYGTEGGENLIFSNNISINSAVGGIMSLYWGENLLITGNLVIVRHEPFIEEYAGRAESTYFGQFVRLHHGPSNPEDKYGTGGVQITGNLFVNELYNRPSGISVEAGRDVLISGNKIINGQIRKHEEFGKVEKGDAGKDEFASQVAVKPEEKVQTERRVGADSSRVTITGNEFISRQLTDKSCVIIDGTVSSAIVKDNVFRRENSIITFTDKQKEAEKGAPRYMMYSADNLTNPDLTNSSPTAAVDIAPFTSTTAIVQGNIIEGWKDSVKASNTSPQGNATFIVTGNITDGTINVAKADRTTQKVEANIPIPTSPAAQ